MSAVERSAPDVKACCVTAYSSDLVSLLLGECLHPGGPALTRRLAETLELRGGQRVVDVASGRGTTALLLNAEYGVDVTGVDLSVTNVAAATTRAQTAGVQASVRFRTGDAERLPVDNAAADVAVCECALCLFNDKPRAAAELARVVRTGGKVGITDVTAQPGRLPDMLGSLQAWVACIADARPLREYAELLAAAGLRVTRTEDHTDAAAAMVDQVVARVETVRLTARSQAEAAGVDFDAAGPLLDAARGAVTDGRLGYCLLVAEKPASPAVS